MDQKLAELLLKKHRQTSTSESIDWDDRRTRYLDAVNGLYHQIETELADPIAQNTVTLRRRGKELNESYIGTYAVDDLILIVGDEQVRFSPRGRNIAGAAGRVDVIGERGEAAMILQFDAKWAFVQTRQPALRTTLFDGSTLAEVLQLVMRA